MGKIVASNQTHDRGRLTGLARLPKNKIIANSTPARAGHLIQSQLIYYNCRFQLRY